MTTDTLSRPEKTDNPIKRVAILFAGGPAPAANAVISSAAISFIRNGAEVIGIKHGYSALMEYDGETPLVEGQDYILLTEASLDQTRTTPGIMIGTARANPANSYNNHLISKMLKRPPHYSAPTMPCVASTSMRSFPLAATIHLRPLTNLSFSKKPLAKTRLPSL